MLKNIIRLCFVRYRCLSTLEKNQCRYLSSISPSSMKLSSTMKNLISARQYLQALDLFDRQIPIRTDASFTLALKAATKLADYERGHRIHQQLSSNSLQNPFIQTTLIHFYSK
jgi:hypothetical protein